MANVSLYLPSLLGIIVTQGLREITINIRKMRLKEGILG
jgi:hypothetical protein